MDLVENAFVETSCGRLGAQVDIIELASAEVPVIGSLLNAANDSEAITTRYDTGNDVSANDNSKFRVV